MLIDETIVDRNDPSPAVDKLLKAIGEKVPLDAERAFRIKLLTMELLNNVICHSSADRIEMRCDLCGGRLEITIDDNGPGFSYHDFINRDVTKGEDLWEQGGRGIFLVRNLSSALTYNERGNSVRVVLDLDEQETPV